MVGMTPTSSGVGVSVGGSSPTNSSSMSNSMCLSNTDPSTSSKEKTPMCLINELARYNKVRTQYLS